MRRDDRTRLTQIMRIKKSVKIPVLLRNVAFNVAKIFIPSMWRFVLFAILILTSCSKQKPDSIGSYNEFYVFADPAVKKTTKNVLSIALEKKITTPRTEKIFSLKWGNFDNLGEYANRRNLIFLVSLKGQGKVSSWVRNSFTPEVLRAVENDEVFVLTQLNVFAKPQTVYYLVGRNPEELAAKILIESDYLFSLADSLVNYHLTDWLYKGFFDERENKKLSTQIAQQYGFRIRIPPLYNLDKSDTNFIWLRKLDPEQWVFVYFEATDDSTLSFDWWLDRRNKVGKLYYEGDVVIDTTVTAEKASIAGASAIRYRGLWMNPKEIIGGPFISYFFYEPNQKRKYIVDCAVFAPVVRKEPYLRHTEIIARTIEMVQ